MFSDPPWTGPLRALALAHAGTTEVVTRAGTGAELRTFALGGTPFLILGPTAARLELAASLTAARDVAGASSKTCRVGVDGWVALTAAISTRRMTAWIAESFALVAAAAATAPAPAPPPPAAPAARKPARRKPRP